MFNVTETLYFGRLPDGAVRILRFTQVPLDPPQASGVYSGQVDIDLTIPASTWPAILAAVSLRGEIEGRFYVAQAFHNNQEALAAWAGQLAQQQASP